jgi:hypothetical protein
MLSDGNAVKLIQDPIIRLPGPGCSLPIEGRDRALCYPQAYSLIYDKPGIFPRIQPRVAKIRRGRYAGAIFWPLEYSAFLTEPHGSFNSINIGCVVSKAEGSRMTPKKTGLGSNLAPPAYIVSFRRWHARGIRSPGGISGLLRDHDEYVGGRPYPPYLGTMIPGTIKTRCGTAPLKEYVQGLFEGDIDVIEPQPGVIVGPSEVSQLPTMWGA